MKLFFFLLFSFYTYGIMEGPKISYASSWVSEIKKIKEPLESKIEKTPLKVMDYIKEIGRCHQCQKLKNLKDDEFKIAKKLLKEVIEKIPKKFKTVVNQHVLKVFFVKGLNAAAFTSGVYSNGLKYGFIVLDYNLLSRKFSDWYLFRIRKNFSSKERVFFKIANNDSFSTLTYVFIHELGHVIGPQFSVYPPSDYGIQLSLKKVFSKSDQEKDQEFNLKLWPYSSIAWKINKMDLLEAKNPKINSLRKTTRFYFEKGSTKKLPSKIYQLLESENFSSLYATKDVYEDFSESFASYFFFYYFKNKYQIEIKKNKKIIQSFGPCWGKKSCRQKELLIKKIFDGKKAL